MCTGPAEEAPDPGTSLQTNVLNSKTAALMPYLPEKPFLLNLGGLKIFPGMKLTVALELPPLLHLVVKKNKGMDDQIFNFTPFELKKTWYGKNTTEGIFCSSLSVNACDKTCTAERDPPADPFSGTVAVNCTMVIYNKTKTILELEKIPLFSDELNIYEKNGTLISDTPVIDALENDFHITASTAKIEHGTLLVHGNKHDHGIIHQGTQIIKNITGF